MLFNLLTSFIDQFSFLNVFRYLTFRTGLSVVTSLVIVIVAINQIIFRKNDYWTYGTRWTN